MSRDFDPITTRERSAAFTLDFNLARLAETNPVTGPSTINAVVGLWLVGVFDRTDEILRTGVRVTAMPFEAATPYDQSDRASTLALGRWMLGEPVRGEDYADAARHMRAHLETSEEFLRKKPRELGYFDFGYLGEYLRSMVEADLARDGCAHYELLRSKLLKLVGIKVPTGAESAYAFACAVRDHGRESKAAVAAGDKILKRRVYGEWLGMGNYRAVASWLAAVRRHTGTPREVILGAYDFVPPVVRERASAWLAP